MIILLLLALAFVGLLIANARHDAAERKANPGKIKVNQTWYYPNEQISVADYNWTLRQVALRQQKEQRQIAEAIHHQHQQQQQYQQQQFLQQQHHHHASVPTFPVGSMTSASHTVHPSTGHQNSTRIYHGQVYGGSYTNNGTYFYDPDNRAVVAE